MITINKRLTTNANNGDAPGKSGSESGKEILESNPFPTGEEFPTRRQRRRRIRIEAPFSQEETLSDYPIFGQIIIINRSKPKQTKANQSKPKQTSQPKQIKQTTQQSTANNSNYTISGVWGVDLH
jgi:hypothetical protein